MRRVSLNSTEDKAGLLVDIQVISEFSGFINNPQPFGTESFFQK